MQPVNLCRPAAAGRRSGAVVLLIWRQLHPHQLLNLGWLQQRDSIAAAARSATVNAFTDEVPAGRALRSH
jgi:hypothetical protein